MYETLCNSNLSSEDFYVDLYNSAGYATRFKVMYLLNGALYSFNSGAFTAGFSRRIGLPANATTISVYVEEDLFIETWYPILLQSFAAPEKICYVAYGITIAPSCVRVPCKSSGSNGGNCCNPCCCCNCGK